MGADDDETLNECLAAPSIGCGVSYDAEGSSLSSDLETPGAAAGWVFASTRLKKPSLRRASVALAAFSAFFLQGFTRGNGDGKIRLWQEVLSGGGAGFFQVAVTK